MNVAERSAKAVAKGSVANTAAASGRTIEIIDTTLRDAQQCLWATRMTAGMIGKTFVIALPGSPKAVRECWDIFSPFLADTLMKIRKQGYEVTHG